MSRIDGKLRFGILCNGYIFPRWQADAIRELLGHENFEAALVVVNNNPQEPAKSFLKKLVRPKLFFHIYENKYLKIPSKKPVDLTDDLLPFPTLKVQTDKKGKFSNYFKGTDVDSIKGYNLDFIIRFGFGIVKGDILNAAKYGIWSFHHGDEQKFRGGPPAFWEIFYKDNATAVILQRLTATLDGGIVLKKGYFKTIFHSYKQNLDTVFTHASHFIKQAGLEILNGQLQPEKVSITSSKGRLYKAPGNFVFMIFLAKVLFNRVRFHLRDIFFIEQWNIGIVKNELKEVLLGKELIINWFPEEKHGFYKADPFIYTQDGNTEIIYEYFDYNKHKGRIDKVTPDGNNNYSAAKNVINTGRHLSYPYIFKDSEKLYCLPESFETKEAMLYEVKNRQFIRKNTLLDNRPVIDPSLFFYNGYYWLFCTLKDSLPNAQLYLFYSESLDGEYIPHPLNPVVTDISSARPAGSIFIYENKLIRPSQNCSITYGGSLKLNEITLISPTQYREEEINELFPEDKIYNKGIHTFSTGGSRIAVDGKRYKFAGSLLFKRLLAKFK